MEESPLTISKADEFMKSFKYYKSNKPKPSLDSVISIEKGCADEVVILFTYSFCFFH